MSVSAKTKSAKVNAITPKKKKSALGRGLSALIPIDDMALLNDTVSGQLPVDKKNIREVPLKQIVANPTQPRRNFPQDEIDELAASIKEHGILQPVLLRPAPNSDNETYEIVAGERRWRAAQLAGLLVIPAVVRQINDQQTLELAIIENVQRQDISALDAAVAYRRLQEEFHLSQEEIAQSVAKSRAAIANTLRLLDLPDEVQTAITQNQISEGHGRAILGAKTDDSRKAILRRIVRDGLTVRQTEELARICDKADVSSSKLQAIPRRNVEERHIEEQLQKILGTRVQLKTGRKGGQITISYFSPEELERLLEHLGI